ASITSSGLLTGGNAGNTTLTATKHGVTSNSVGVVVSDAVITHISVTPPAITLAKGQDQTLIATATYSDSSSADISDSVTWSPADTGTASVTPEGQVTGVSVGTTTVTASKDSITSNTIDVDVTNAVMTELTLNPPLVGLTTNNAQPMKATAIYSDGTSSDVTRSVTWWTPIDNTEMSVTADGLVTALKVGNSRITASINGFSHSIDVNVCSIDSLGLTGKCIDILNAGNGKLFTSSPSVAYLESLGLGGSHHTSGTSSMFYIFDHPKATALCTQYSKINLSGRSNWRLPTLREIRYMYRDMSISRGWNISTHYWTSTAMNGGNGGYWGGYKYNNSWGTWGAFLGTRFSYLASCVSEP
ncbi:Ig-like domain-containing protein, partial [Vibrio neptunius]|uniref:Ig-like domain-containing protein n=1 Tax=Vibrio neptunius TaxID=170651 RepID=UPI0030DBDB05